MQNFYRLPRARCARHHFYPHQHSFETGGDGLHHHQLQGEAVVASASLAEVAIEAAASGGLSRCLSVGGHIDGFEPLDEQLAALPITPIEDEFLGAPMLYSSGTTGKPKGVYWEPHAESIHTEHPMSGSVGAFFGFGVDTVYLSPAPSITRHPCTTTSWYWVWVAPL